jgi:hypothetical protein
MPVKAAEPEPSEPCAWQAAQDQGVDMTLLEDSLRRTPEERIRENSRALALADALQEAMRTNHARP